MSLEKFGISRYKCDRYISHRSISKKQFKTRYRALRRLANGPFRYRSYGDDLDVACSLAYKVIRSEHPAFELAYFGRLLDEYPKYKISASRIFDARWMMAANTRW